MSTFVNPKARIQVDFKDHHGGENIVWIKAKMDIRTLTAVQTDLMKIQIDTTAASNGSLNSVDFLFSPVGQKLAMLRYNITRWRGPLFVDEDGRPVPCKPEMIDRLNYEENEYWIDMVLDKINVLNAPRTSDPNQGNQEKKEGGQLVNP